MVKHFTLLQNDTKPDEDEKKRLWKYYKLPDGNIYLIGLEVFKDIDILSNNSIIRVGRHVHPYETDNSFC